MADNSSFRNRPFDFHVLVIGRANAGKTTLLKRFCSTDEELLVKRGGESDFHPQEQIDGTLRRGNHNIHDQYMFRNSPGLIFHDSCGLEAGSLKEKDNIKDFINVQASSTIYRNHVHVIWLCLPIDEARPLQDNELWLLDSGVHGRVPVIAILTKCDGLGLKIWEEIIQGNKDEDENDEIDLEVDRRLMRYIEEKKRLLGSMKHAPQAVVWTTELQQEEGAARPAFSQLKSLTDATFNALSDERLRSMFAIVQRNNIWVVAKSCYMGNDTTASWGSSTRDIVVWAMRATMDPGLDNNDDGVVGLDLLDLYHYNLDGSDPYVNNLLYSLGFPNHLSLSACSVLVVTAALAVTMATVSQSREQFFALMKQAHEYVCTHEVHFKLQGILLSQSVSAPRNSSQQDLFEAEFIRICKEQFHFLLETLQKEGIA